VLYAYVKLYTEQQKYIATLQNERYHQIACYFPPGRGQIQWDFVHGLFEYAIYGGRVDNPFDNRVMVSYLKQLFDPNNLSEQNRGGKRLGPLQVPNSTMSRV
jgi:hypothetical protein